MAKVKVKSKSKTSEAIAASKRISMSIVSSLSPTQKKKYDPIYCGASTPFPVIKNVINTGCPNIDIVCARSTDGNWGLPSGRICFLQGKPKVGKTTFVISLLKSIQDRNGVSYLIESEHSLDKKYALTMGVDVSQIIYSPASFLEECVDKITSAVRVIATLRQMDKELPDVPVSIIVDSISQLPTLAELKGQGGGMGEHARIISEMCRTITKTIGNLNVMLFFVLQERKRIGVTFGDNSTFIGGDALKFACSVGLKMVRISYLKDGDEKVGIRSRISCIWNKCRPPWGAAEVDIFYGRGIDLEMALFDGLKDNKLLKKRGNRTYVYKDINGKEYSFEGAANFEPDPDVRGDMIEALYERARTSIS